MWTLHRVFLALILFCILSVTLIDVVGRALFNAPFFGADDLIRFSMALLVYAALPAICARGDHITVDLFSGRLAPIVRGLLLRLFSLIAMVVLGFLSWRLFEVGMVSLQYNEQSPLMRLPMAPLAFFMAAAAGVSALIELRNAVWPGAGKTDGRPSPAGSHG
jgi:TRAP-type C4-dicarboxylate transport system permease small subunit